MTTFDISVVVPTYNRGSRLGALLQRLLDQDAPRVGFEIVVVDNNSTDGTRAVVEQAMAGDSTGRLRYEFEPRQGVSYARNTGVERSSGDIILLLDDDGMPGRDWVQAMMDAFLAHPEADLIGGRVTPDFEVAPPAWLDKPHYGPIAVQDRPEPIYVSARSASVCLLTANLGVRREVFKRVGGFSPAYRRNQDREWELRVWRAGMQGLYLPAMEVKAAIPADRLTRRYHRRWQAATGMYHALMRFRDTVDADGALCEEPPDRRTLLGSPLFLYREFAGHVGGWLRSLLLHRPAERFFHETRLWYYVSFFKTRIRHPRPQPTDAPVLAESTPISHLSMPQPDATILIATYNRAAYLRETLNSLRDLRPSTALSWDVLIVDNNSTDDTAAVVANASREFPVPVHYMRESRQGKSIALNSALAQSNARVIVFTDDDVRVPPDWLDRAVHPLLHDDAYSYTGGPVRPWWGGEPPAWLERSGNQTAPLAAVDYGADPFVFEERQAIPLGVNMAVCRSVFDRVGGFHPDLGRTGRSLLGQEQAEFFQRCRAAGVRGLYVPEMWLEHYVPAERLTASYFSRWWYYKGISQARWHRMHGVTETGVDLTRVRMLLGVPRYAFATAASDLHHAVKDLVTGRRASAASHALMVVYFVGYCRERWFGRRTMTNPLAATRLADTNGVLGARRS